MTPKLNTKPTNPTTTTATATRLRACGFCASGTHERCPGSIQNATGLWRCQCEQTERCGQLRCTTCGNREPGTVNEQGACLDGDACRATVAASQRAARVAMNMPADLDVHQTSTDTEGNPVLAVQHTRPTKPAKPASGQCVCCGEATKGGLFLPGHDSRWLSLQVACYTEGGQDRAEVAEYMRSRGASEALVAKFNKRVGLA